MNERVLFYGDLHVTHRNKEYMGFLEATIDFLLETIKQRSITHLVNLGDTLDTFGVLDIRDVLWAMNAMDLLTEAVNGNHIILRGNHDTADRLGGLSSVHLFRGSRQRPVIVSTIGPHLLGEHQVLCLPYTKDMEDLKDQLERAKSWKPRAVLAHVDWLGCRLTPTYVSQEGLLPSLVGAMFPGATVFAGHYHAPTSVPPVIFVGSPLHMTFNDQVDEIPRGFTFWESNGIAGYIERIANPNTYECWTVRAKTEKELLAEHAKLEEKQSRVRVRVYVPNKLIETASRIFEGYLWNAVYPLESEKAEVEFATKVSLTTTPEEVIRKAVGTAPKELDMEMLTRYGDMAFPGRTP